MTGTTIAALIKKWDAIKANYDPVFPNHELGELAASAMPAIVAQTELLEALSKSAVRLTEDNANLRAELAGWFEVWKRLDSDFAYAKFDLAHARAELEECRKEMKS